MVCETLAWLVRIYGYLRGGNVVYPPETHILTQLTGGDNEQSSILCMSLHNGDSGY